MKSQLPKVQETKYAAADSCNSGISVLNHCPSWSKFVNTYPTPDSGLAYTLSWIMEYRAAEMCLLMLLWGCDCCLVQVGSSISLIAMTTLSTWWEYALSSAAPCCIQSRVSSAGDWVTKTKRRRLTQKLIMKSKLLWNPSQRSFSAVFSAELSANICRSTGVGLWFRFTVGGQHKI